MRPGKTDEFDAAPFAIAGPTDATWREHVLARVGEHRFLMVWLASESPYPDSIVEPVLQDVEEHLSAAEKIAERGTWRWRFSRSTSVVERAKSHLDAAEADLLRLAPTSYLRGQLPDLEAHVMQWLDIGDPRRVEIERLARRVRDHEPTDADRNALVAAFRATNSEARRATRRLQSFRNLVLVATGILSLLALGMAVLGLASPTTVPMCFTPPGEVVCPIGTSSVAGRDVEDVLVATVNPWDIALVELIGMIAAAATAALGLRSTRGTSAPFGMPILVGLMKLPTGALTAFIGILLLRAEFIPGFNALESSAQILAWAAVFGAAQQILTRQIDQRAQEVLEDTVGTGGGKIDSGTVGAEALERAVTSTLRRELSPPRLISYRGAVSAQLRDREGHLLGCDNYGRFSIKPGEPHHVHVSIGSVPAPATVSAPILIEEGDRAPRVPFTIELEGDRLADAPREQSVEVADRDASASVTFVIETDPEPVPSSLWIRVTQHGRLVQVLELEFAPPT
jgi:hypothetical protein